VAEDAGPLRVIEVSRMAPMESILSLAMRLEADRQPTLFRRADEAGRDVHISRAAVPRPVRVDAHRPRSVDTLVTVCRNQRLGRDFSVGPTRQTQLYGVVEKAAPDGITISGRGPHADRRAEIRVSVRPRGMPMRGAHTCGRVVGASSLSCGVAARLTVVIAA
jgi:hypothetical protein